MTMTAVREFVSLLFAASALLGITTTFVDAQVAQRLPDLDKTATSIAEVDGVVWVATPEGAYRIEGDDAVRVPDYKLDVTGIYPIDGVVWLATTQGAYRIDGDTAVRVPNRGLVVTSITKVGDQIWLAATNGAYLIDGDDARRVPDRDFDVAAITDIDGLPWLATDSGAYALSPNPSTAPGAGPFVGRHVVNVDYDLNQILEIDGRPWLATDHGAYRIDPDGPHHIAIITQSNPTLIYSGKAMEIFRILPVDGRVWFIGASGVFRLAEPSGPGPSMVAYRIPDDKVAAATIAGAGGRTWLATRTGAYRVDGDQARRVPDLPLDVTSVADIEGTVWLATTQGAYRVQGDTARRIPDVPLSISGISEVGGKTFLATANGAYVVDGESAYPVVDSSVAVLSLTSAGGMAWLSTSAGAFRVDPDRIVAIKLVSHKSGFVAALRRLLPPGVDFCGTYGLRVVYVQRMSTDEPPAVDARVNLSATRQVAVSPPLVTHSYVDPASIALDIKPGDVTVGAMVKDGWSPPVERSVSFVAVPVWLAVVVLLMAVWMVFILGVLLVSPFVDTCQKLLMLPWLRNAGSLGLIPLLLAAAPPLRLFLLIRYRRQLAEGLGTREPADDISDRMAGVASRLSVDHVATTQISKDSEPFVTACDISRMFLAGASGYNKGDARGRALSGAVPLPLLLSGDEVSRLEAEAIKVLYEYGSITDPSLARRLLATVPFVFVLEGETPSALSVGEARGYVDRFAATRRRVGYVCIIAEQAAAS